MPHPFMSRHTPLCLATPLYITPRPLYHATPLYIMPHPFISFHTPLYHATPLYVMPHPLCHATPFYVMQRVLMNQSLVLPELFQNKGACVVGGGLGINTLLTFIPKVYNVSQLSAGQDTEEPGRPAGRTQAILIPGGALGSAFRGRACLRWTRCCVQRQC